MDMLTKKSSMFISIYLTIIKQSIIQDSISLFDSDSFNSDLFDSGIIERIINITKNINFYKLSSFFG